MSTRRVKARQDKYPWIKRLLRDRRIALSSEHEDGERDRQDRQYGEERLDVCKIIQRAALSAPGLSEAERDGADRAPNEQRGDACEIEQPGEHDAFAPDGGQEGQERHCERHPSERH